MAEEDLETLENLLCSELQCTVCRLVPTRSDVVSCVNGHLTCHVCFANLVCEIRTHPCGRLEDCSSICPACRHPMVVFSSLGTEPRPR